MSTLLRSLVIQIIISLSLALTTHATYIVINYDPNIDPLNYDYIGWVKSQGEVEGEIFGDSIANVVVRFTVIENLLPGNEQLKLELECYYISKLKKEATDSEQVFMLAGQGFEFPKGSEWLVYAKKIKGNRYRLDEDGFDDGLCFKISGGWFAQSIPKSYQSKLCLSRRPKVSDFMKQFREKSLYMKLKEGTPFLRKNALSPNFTETPKEGFNVFMTGLIRQDYDAIIGHMHPNVLYFDIKHYMKNPSEFTNYHVRVLNEAIMDNYAAVIYEEGRAIGAEVVYEELSGALLIYKDGRWEYVAGYIDSDDLSDNQANFNIPYVKMLEAWTRVTMKKRRNKGS